MSSHPPADATSGEAPAIGVGLVLVLALLAALVPLPGEESRSLLPAPAAWGWIVAGSAAMAATWRWPRAGTAVLVVLVFCNLSQVLVRQHHVPSLLQAMLVVLALIAWRLHGSGGLAAAVSHRIGVAAAAYLLLVLLSTTWADAPGLAEARLLHLAKAAIIACVLAVLASDRAGRWSAAWALAGSAAALSALGIARELTGEPLGWLAGLARVKVGNIHGEIFEPRIAGPLGDPNYFAQSLLTVLPIVVVLGWTARGAMRRGAATAAGGAVLLAVALTYSRGAVLALGAQIALAIALSRRRLALGGLAALILGGVLLLAPGSLTERIASINQLVPGGGEVLEPDSSFQERRLFTRTAWAMFVDHPIRGVGAGNYSTRFTEYADRVGSVQRSYDPPGRPHYPHSLYLEIAAETGVLGLTTFAALLLTVFVSLGHARRRFLARGRTDDAALTWAVALGLAGYLVAALFLHGDFVRYFWLPVGLAMALDLGSRRAEERGSDG